MASTDTEFVSECGGNNPCIIVPGDRPWTKAEIKHHAGLLATFGKINGGAVCGRAQTLVTSKNWPQRREFLDAVPVHDDEQEEAEELLGVLEVESRRVNNRIQQFLDFARPPRVAPRPTDLGQLVRSVEESARATGALKPKPRKVAVESSMKGPIRSSGSPATATPSWMPSKKTA